MKRLAVCYSGMCRDFDLCYPSFYDNILSQWDGDIHFFFFFWDIIDKGKYRGALTTDLLDMFFTLLPQPPKLGKLVPPISFTSRHGQNLMSMFYAIKEANELKTQYEKRHNFQYDCVMRVRTDTGFHQPIESDRFSAERLTKIHARDFINTSYLNDQFAFSNSHNMDLYSSTYDLMSHPDIAKFGGDPEKILGTAVQQIHHLEVDWLDSKLFWF